MPPSEIRPLIHFTPEKGWMNDPNGLFYLRGKYHLFFQHSPEKRGRPGRQMRWGHAVSRNLIDWEEMPVAMRYSEKWGENYSGSALVDHKNPWKIKSPEKPVFLFYTKVRNGIFSQCASLSRDGGTKWRKIGRPILGELAKGNRDPKILYHRPSGKYIMLLWMPKGIRFFRSPDMRKWEACGFFHGPYECPDFFPLRDEKGNEKWILTEANGNYYIGDFDGREFRGANARGRLDLGGRIYASQTWENSPFGKEKRIQIAWIKGGKYPGTPFSQQMSFPCELKLRREGRLFRLNRMPVKIPEKRLRALPARFGYSRISAEIPRAAEINAELSGSGKMAMELDGNQIRFGPGKCSINRKEFKIPENGIKDFKIITDSFSLEIFINSGRSAITRLMLPREKRKMEITPSGNTKIKRIEILAVIPRS